MCIRDRDKALPFVSKASARRKAEPEFCDEALAEGERVGHAVNFEKRVHRAGCWRSVYAGHSIERRAQMVARAKDCLLYTSSQAGDAFSDETPKPLK